MRNIMAEEKLLTIRDVSLILGITEKEVIDLAQEQLIPAYRIAGLYLRFKRHQIEDYKRKHKISPTAEREQEDYSLRDRLSDFLYYNDFYILSFLIVLLILFVIGQGY